MSVLDHLPGRAPASSGEVQLVAELEQARTTLLEVEQQAATAVGNARAAVTSAQSRVDEWRLGQVSKSAQSWRRRAQELRRQASEAGDSTTVISRTVLGGMGGSELVPELIFRSEQLESEASEYNRTSGGP